MFANVTSRTPTSALQPSYAFTTRLRYPLPILFGDARQFTCRCRRNSVLVYPVRCWLTVSICGQWVPHKRGNLRSTEHGQGRARTIFTTVHRLGGRLGQIDVVVVQVAAQFMPSFDVG